MVPCIFDLGIAKQTCATVLDEILHETFRIIAGSCLIRGIQYLSAQKQALHEVTSTVKSDDCNRTALHVLGTIIEATHTCQHNSHAQLNAFSVSATTWQDVLALSGCLQALEQ